MTCRRQSVKRVERKLGGTMLTLACGHGRWYGGQVFPTVPSEVECLTGPCYQADRFMGDCE